MTTIGQVIWRKSPQKSALQPFVGGFSLSICGSLSLFYGRPFLVLFSFPFSLPGTDCYLSMNSFNICHATFFPHVFLAPQGCFVISCSFCLSVLAVPKRDAFRLDVQLALS
ncbi:hypothetical protein C8R43DRAFT_1018951, partial [Mycena crocata]